MPETTLSEAFDLIHGLIQEAKGYGNGSVVDHLDAAENWLDKAEEIIAGPEGTIKAKIEARIRSIEIDERPPGIKDDFTRGCLYAYEELLKDL